MKERTMNAKITSFACAIIAVLAACFVSPAIGVGQETLVNTDKAPTGTVSAGSIQFYAKYDWTNRSGTDYGARVEVVVYKWNAGTSEWDPFDGGVGTSNPGTFIADGDKENVDSGTGTETFAAGLYRFKVNFYKNTNYGGPPAWTPLGVSTHWDVTVQ